MSTENERNSRRTVAVTALTVAGTGAISCLIGGYILNRLGYVSISGENGSSGTKSPTTEPTLTPDFTSTIPFRATPTRTLAPTLTSTFTSTSTPESGERTLIEKFLAEGEGIISDYPAFLNVLGVESLGVSQVNIDKFKDYFLQRELKVTSGNTEIPRLDRMFGQLSLPVKNLSDRGLNFDWRNNGQGLGFDLPDFDVLRTLEQMKQVQGFISRLDADGNYRAWTVANARDFEKVVLAFVDEDLRISGVTNPATNPAVQDERRTLFNRIVYGDLGVQAGDTDGLWQTVNDKFWIPCETHMANAQVRSKQSEVVRGVEFNPDQETENGGKEGDTTYVRDSDNSVLVAMVYSPADGHLRVEAYDLSDPPDPLNPGLDSTTRAFGGRWLPCGPGATVIATPTPGFFNSAPGKTSTNIPSIPTLPEQPSPTSVPTNTKFPIPTLEFTATTIPTLPEQPSPTYVPTNTKFPTPTATRGSLPTLEFTATTIPPTSVPTNKDYPIPTATEGSAPTLEPTATDIP